ncbi:MAG: hypothetical protein ABSG82_02410 [Sedimentisphaerales bacterium]|jgi:hypothetical protein
MKRLLLVLLVLGLSVPAVANVFVYNLKQSGVEFEYNADTKDGEGAWVQSPKSSDTEYVVIQVDSNSPDSVNIYSINTQKGKDPDTGEAYKNYTVDGPYTISFLQTTIAKNMWIVEGTLDDGYNTRITLSGQAKSSKIGSHTYTVAAALSGYSIYGSINDNQDIGGGPVSLTLNSKITTALVSSDADVIGAIDTYFQGLGYEPGSD